eukprot:TRINITY_DN5266_c1_g2_i1.p1 TRINITY_DN5266_c1_g2~~TRINITY_DN5266_c1_g2_i1.p1  ORF type:complete len:537 (-),score=86.51 TRINITY_DN5266_c1_g2_i1:458-2068(-)
MPSLATAPPLRGLSHEFISAQETCGESAFAAACRELLRLHEEELQALRLRCKRLQESHRSAASEEHMTDIVALCDSCESQPEGLVVESSEANLMNSLPLETAAAKFSTRSSIFRASEESLNHISANRKPTTVHGSTLQRFVSGHWFELISCTLVVCNALILAFEAQYHGHSIGYALQHSRHITSADEYYPNAQAALTACSWIFGIVFALEVGLRMCASLRKCVQDAWVWFDALVVIVWAISKVGDVLSVDSTVLRLARLLRLLRLLKLARALKHFDSLCVIITATNSCFVILFWTFVTFGLVQLFLSLLLTQYLQLFYFHLTNDSSDQALVFTYYGTFVRSFFTLWEITLGNWPPACRILAENVNEYFFALGLLHKLLFGFAIVAIINAVFIQETFKVTARDDLIMVREKNKVMKNHMNKMRKLLNHADTDGDGKLCFEEWEAIMQDPGLKTWLASMDLDVHDARFIFKLCDTSSDGYLTLEELVHGIGRFRGPAKSVDLHAFADSLEGFILGSKEKRPVLRHFSSSASLSSERNV